MKSPGREILLAGVAAVAFTLACFVIGYVSGDPNVSLLSDAGDTAKLLTLTIGVPAAILALFNHARGVRQQREADLWRRREYVAKVFADFEANEQNRFCMAMLDYNRRSLLIPGTTERRLLSEQDMLTALAPRAPRGVYHTHDALIRDAFDGFFNTLDRIAAMRVAGLVDWGDIEPYAAYWLKLLDRGPRNRSEEFGPIIRRYVHKYQSANLAKLMTTAGVNATYSAQDDVLVKAFVAKLSVLPEPGDPAKPVAAKAEAPKGGAVKRGATKADTKAAGAKAGAAKIVTAKPPPKPPAPSRRKRPT